MTDVPVPLIDSSVYRSRNVKVGGIRQEFVPHATEDGAFFFNSWRLQDNMSMCQYISSRPMRHIVPTNGSRSPAEYYWNNLAGLDITYGADIHHNYCSGSVFDAGHLPGILRTCQAKLLGVTDSYAYCGEFGSTFTTHVEDLNLHSLNLIIDGASKIWYGVPPQYHQSVKDLGERLYQDKIPCGLPLLHKMVLLSPSILHRYKIPFCEVSCPL